jgi:prepilin-type N-terminal cleavage/methylation domain-containing protein
VAKTRAQRGFSLIEILITMALVSVLSVIALNALTPWLTFKQALDTDRKLQDLRQGLQAAYDANAMTVDVNTSNTAVLLGGAGTTGLSHDTAAAGASCNSQADALSSMSNFLTESGEVAARDGFASPVCFFITPRLQRDVEGVRIYYHTIAIVSTGQDGVLDGGTSFSQTTGQLTLGGDDRGVVINGYSLEYAKYRDTLDRMNRIAALYENYFTTRFANTADRDVTRNYFYNGSGTNGDANGTISATSGWTATLGMFGTPLGVGRSEATSAFESNNAIEVANNTESVTVRGQTTTVRSPASLGTGATPPYTAILRARLPGPADSYVVRVVVGNY